MEGSGLHHDLLDLPDDASLLVSGPPMSGKYDLMLSVLLENADDRVIISTKHPANRLTQDVSSRIGRLDGDRLGIIDCISHHEGVNDAEDSDTLKHVPSPENLTQIGVKFTELFRYFDEERGVDHACVGLHSLSQLLMYTSIERVYKFLQVLTGQIKTAGWGAVLVLDTAVVSEEESVMLNHHVDRVVETRFNSANQKEYRVKTSGHLTEWIRLDN